jgi:hypothetical protein
MLRAAVVVLGLVLCSAHGPAAFAAGPGKAPAAKAAKVARGKPGGVRGFVKGLPFGKLAGRSVVRTTKRLLFVGAAKRIKTGWTFRAFLREHPELVDVYDKQKVREGTARRGLKVFSGLTMMGLGIQQLVQQASFDSPSSWLALGLAILGGTIAFEDQGWLQSKVYKARQATLEKALKLGIEVPAELAEAFDVKPKKKKDEGGEAAADPIDDTALAASD